MEYFGFILIYLIGIVDGLKCYAGNPARKHECNTISYCLYITSRTGRTQWSCDGNAITQVSICSSFGMDAPRHRIYEATSRADSFYRPSDSATASGSLYYVKQKLDSRLTPFVNDIPNSNNNNDPDFGDNSDRNNRNGQRCFDGGQIGKVCCCDTDFCNSSNLKFNNNFIPLFLRVFLIGFSILLYQFLLL